MFTGLVQRIGRVSAVRPGIGLTEIVIDPGPWEHHPEVGESICISGCCLSVVDPAAQGGLLFHAVPETLAKTNLGEFTPGRLVNMERSLRASDLLGGHIVQGHVDDVGIVRDVRSSGEYRVRIQAPQALREYLVPKGSVCVDGVSLTIADLDPQQAEFEVALIPVTLEATTLSQLRAGNRVNLEMDAMAKTIVHYLRQFGGRA